MELDFDGVEVEVEVLPEADQLRQWLLNTLLDMRSTEHKGDATIRSLGLHGPWESTGNVIWEGLVMENNTWGALHVSFAVVQLKKEDTSQLLVLRVSKVYLESDRHLLVAWEYPKPLVLSVVDLAWIELFLSSQNHLHSLPDWRSEEIPLETGESVSYLLSVCLTLLPDLFVFCADGVGLFFAQSLANLYIPTI